MGWAGEEVPPTPRALAAGPPPGEKRERSRHLGTDTWAGEGKESLKVEVAAHSRRRGSPTPTLQCSLDKKGAKGLGRRDRWHRQRRRDCRQGAQPVLTSGLIIQKPCRENKRKCKREGREKKKRKRNEGVARATATQMPLQGEEPGEALKPAPRCPHTG